MTTWVNPHYFAPAGPALLLLVIQGIRHLRVRARAVETSFSSVPSLSDEGGERVGKTGNLSHQRFVRGGVARLVWALVLAQLIGFVPYAWFHVRQPAEDFASRRAELVRQLHASPGQHLVIVRYGSDYNIHQEWVHNGADIDTARIVWARQMNPAADRQLGEYFRDRHRWLLQADEASPRLVPYGESTRPES